MFSKTSIKFIAAAAVILTLALASPAAAQRRASAQVGSEGVGGFAELYDAIEPVPLSADYEEPTLIYLWEEEKLARDVYNELAYKWQLPIFSNIADEPTAHLDSSSVHSFIDLAFELVSRGKSVIIASHDPAISDGGSYNQVFELRDGRLA
jgi:hypothetical protein